MNAFEDLKNELASFKKTMAGICWKYDTNFRECQDLATLSQKTMLSRFPNPMLERFLDRPQGILVVFV